MDYTVHVSKNKRLMLIFSVLCGLTLLIVLSSVIFAVHDVRVYCLNIKDDDPQRAELDQKVLDNHGILTGTSIFTISEKKTIAGIRRELALNHIADIEIRKIERHFPNRVEIHYVKIEPYFYVIQGSKAYFYSNGMELMQITESDEVKQGAYQFAVEFKAEGRVTETDVGSSEFSTDKMYEQAGAEAAAKALETLCAFSELRDYLNFIDVSREGYVFAKTRLGVTLEFSSLERFSEQFRLGVSAYKEFRESGVPGDYVRARDGTIIVSLTAKGVTAAYSPENRYG